MSAFRSTHNLPIAYAEPDGVERGQEGQRQHRADGGPADQHISHGSPEHGMREWNKGQHCGQRGQDDGARLLDGGNSMADAARTSIQLSENFSISTRVKISVNSVKAIKAQSASALNQIPAQPRIMSQGDKPGSIPVIATDTSQSR